MHRTRELTLKDGPDAEGVFRLMLAPPVKKQSSSWFGWGGRAKADGDTDDKADEDKAQPQPGSNDDDDD